ncbi:hypothetical protein [Ammoniphilus sp. CFH 90114]|uniref:hypothetical protein n=1 Tax=Ammoniphilus sp. CFH 90114 TaxID=2493665 RepID=UPI00100DACF2|nr:hypothetical protein [Ammoniphilus sp. CFH 90114]RXT06258.1 hypothetical protein EIZ39_14310 [Ammoniphilus sp. CFH 90114]
MSEATDRIHVAKFRFLNEFRSWLELNRDKDIIDISTAGGIEDLMILITYKEGKDGNEEREL